MKILLLILSVTCLQVPSVYKEKKERKPRVKISKTVASPYSMNPLTQFTNL